jgi:glutamyl-tRNA reductase
MTPAGVDLTVQSEAKPSQQSLLIMDWGPTLGAIRRKFQDIARAEFRKQRRRLGVLSTEQEAAIEVLLITTVNKISQRVVPEIKRLIETIG